MNQWPLWWSKFPAALFYPRLLFSYFENRMLFSYMTENTLHLFLLNKDIYLENINSMITQPHQILTVHQVMWASYQEVDDHPNSCLHLLFYYRMIHNPKYEAWGLLLKSRNRKNVWSSNVDHLFFNLWNFNCIFQSCRIFCVILTVDKNQRTMLMILDNFSNTSKVLEQENIDELYTDIYVNFKLHSSHLLLLS